MPSSLLSRLVTILLLLSPILQTYGWEGGLNFSLIINTLFIVVFLLKKGLCNSIPKWLTIYIIYYLFIYYVQLRDFKSILPLNIIYPILAYMMLFKCIDLRILIKYYKAIAAICIAFFFIQELSYYTTGIRINGMISYLPLALNVDDAVGFYDSVAERTRSSSFFSEPAHFVQFLLPLFAILLLDNNRKNYLFAGIIFITLLLLQSGNAVFGLVAVFCVFVYKVLANSSAKYKLLGIAGSMALSVAVYGVYINSNMGEELTERQDEVSGEVEITSGFIRIFRGYYVFDTYSSLEKICGLPHKQSIKEKIDISEVYYMFDDNDMYFNAIQTILIRTGYIGLLLFLIMLISIWRNNSYSGKAIILTFFILSFISSLFFSMTMAMYLILAYNLQQENKSLVKHTLIACKQ